MSCHESLMARRRKNKKATRNPTPASNGLNKSLPDIPQHEIPPSAFDTPDLETPSSDKLNDSVYSGGASSSRATKTRKDATDDDQILLPASTFQGTTASNNNNNNRTSSNSKTLSYADNGTDFFGSVPFMLDPKDSVSEASPPPRSGEFSEAGGKMESKGTSRDYFGRTPASTSLREPSLRESLKQESRSSSVERNQGTSPHIAYQQKDRKATEHISDTMRKRQDEQNRSNAQVTSLQDSSTEGDFKLQDVPKQRKTSTPRQNSRNEGSTTAASSQVVERNDQARENKRNLDAAPRLVERISYVSDDWPSPGPGTPQSLVAPTKEVERPKRGDSLAASALKPSVTRKEVGSAGSSGRTTPTPPTTHDRAVPSSASQSSRFTSKQTESPESKTQFEPPPRAPSRPGTVQNTSETDIFAAPRAPPPAPPVTRHAPSASTSTVRSDSSTQKSPNLPRSSTGGEFSMTEEFERIMGGGEKSSEPGMFRKVSNAVKHGRSFSDRAPRSERSSQSQKWPRSPLNGSMEISSPTSATSPNAHEENILLKNKLRQAQERIAKLELEKNGLQTLVSNNVDISQVNIELKEKRSTMAFLDTQRELVVRELEIMTEHLRRAKDSNQALDVNELKSGVTRDFAAALQKLKDTLGKQIEELMQKRNDLTSEIDDLIQMKDKGFQEYESLSARNHQLTQHNNELIASIQGNMKASARHNAADGSADAGRQMANGLGLYISQNKHGVRQDSNDLRELLSSSTDYSQTTLATDQDSEPLVVATPQVVKIGKGRPNVFKKGTQGFVKGLRNVRKELAGAERTDRSAERNNSMPYNLEGTPYNQMPQVTDQSRNETRTPADAAGRQKFGDFFRGERSEKGHLKHLKGGPNSSNTNLVSDSNLVFGTDLSLRCEYEKRVIPSIVSRCIEEVELRGMDVEGIYRKSGGTGQVNQIRAGFEKDVDYDISDPDLDIHAVTSALKQYLRKLPTPLITYDVYEHLLECARIEDQKARAQPMKAAINALPKSHKDCLEFLVFHLAKVMAHEKHNLMTPLNLAVVFAPTIMRPVSIEREMSDMQLQRIAVQSILEMNQVIFGYDM
ncbi:hypothetical protein, variant [Verruconis gallopava]|nr:hypothetical protein, variant [Verruconis gallopava]KIW09040.1 hypothetical protein, variant [Verruconis gallopava]